MKIFDKTPFQTAQGEIDFSGRIQGTLKYGFSWYADLQAQKAVIAQLDRLLEKGFVLIRNFTLPDSEIVIPIILLGVGGVTVVNVTNVKGLFEAKGDQWNTLVNGRGIPASVNLLNRTAQFARALQVYFNRQKIQIPAPIEPVLIAANPGAQVESMRPVARVVMSDAIKQFASTLLQARPVWRVDNVHDVADRIINPRPPEQLQAQPAEQALASQTPESAASPSRAKAIFDAAENAQEFNPADLEFAFDDAGTPQGVPPHLKETSPAQPLPRKTGPQKRKILGMTVPQFALLAGMVIVEFCMIVIFGIVIILSR
jgi:hypothetical protein